MNNKKRKPKEYIAISSDGKFVTWRIFDVIKNYLHLDKNHPDYVNFSNNDFFSTKLYDACILLSDEVQNIVYIEKMLNILNLNFSVHSINTTKIEYDANLIAKNKENFEKAIIDMNEYILVQRPKNILENNNDLL